MLSPPFARRWIGLLLHLSIDIWSWMGHFGVSWVEEKKKRNLRLSPLKDFRSPQLLELSKMLIRCFDPPALTSWPPSNPGLCSTLEHDNYKYRTNLPQKSVEDRRPFRRVAEVVSPSFLYCCWFSRVTTPHYENKQDAVKVLVLMMKSEEWLSVANVSIVG